MSLIFVPIREHVVPVRTWSPASAGEATVSYVDLSSVSSSTKQITKVTEVAGKEAPSRARQLIERGDVLVSTVRPNLNSVAFVTASHHGHTASTGFTVLRPGPGLDGRYLFHWVRSTAFIDAMTRRATGASYPAVSDRIVLDSEFPLPLLPEQRRIAEILDQADALISNQRKVVSHLDRLDTELVADRLRSVPTQPATAAELMPSMRNGLSPSTRGTVEGQVLTLAAVTSGTFNERAQKPARFDRSPGADQHVTSRDMLISRGNGNVDLVGIGVVAAQDHPDLVFPDTVIAGRIDTEIVDPVFLQAVWATHAVREQVRASARTTNGTFKVNQAGLARVVVSLPTLKIQGEIADELIAVRAKRRQATDRATQLDALFVSLQSRAFRGEL